MTDKLTIEEFKAVLELFYNTGYKSGTQRDTSAGRLQDRGEKRAPTFEQLFDDMIAGKIDIKSFK